MTSLVTLRQVTKGFGERALFTGLTLNLAEDDRLGVVGPNGAGKSTLLGLLGGRDVPDSGERLVPRPLRTGWLEQGPGFPPEATLEEVLVERLAEGAAPGGDGAHLVWDEATWPVRASVTLGRLGFSDPSARVSTLSGGWHRRLALARALVNDPELLLLDEPTNHLDLGSILWLERFLGGLRAALVVISHDRAFLQKVARRVLEVDPRYPGGTFLVSGPYSELLVRREEFIEAESSRRASLQNKVAREVEWLSRGPKARGTKARGRIDEAERLRAELAEMKIRGREGSTGIDFTATSRQTRRLLVAEDLGCRWGGRWLFRHLDLLLRPGMRLGLVGPNGSGKTTLLRMLAGELGPREGGPRDGDLRGGASWGVASGASGEGTIRTAPLLQTVCFDQRRETLDPGLTLRRALAPEGDSVLYQGRPVHVVGWAKRFRFRAEQLDQPLGRLSGGEQAKVLIARLMLGPADLLLLDEPTNDLDLPTLEVLEESLLGFPGAVVLVTHDRYLLDRVSTLLLGLGGMPAQDGLEGTTRLHADVSQWLTSLEAGRAGRAGLSGDLGPGNVSPERAARSSARPRAPRSRKSLTYGEEIELGGLEPRIAQAEAELARLREELVDPQVASDAQRLAERFAAVGAAQADLAALVDRWAELEAKREGES